MFLSLLLRNWHGWSWFKRSSFFFDFCSLYVRESSLYRCVCSHSLLRFYVRAFAKDKLGHLSSLSFLFLLYYTFVSLFLFLLFGKVWGSIFVYPVIPVFNSCMPSKLSASETGVIFFVIVVVLGCTAFCYVRRHCALMNTRKQVSASRQVSEAPMCMSRKRTVFFFIFLLTSMEEHFATAAFGCAQEQIIGGCGLYLRRS